MDYHPDCQGSVAGFYHDMLDLAVTAEHHFANYGLCPAPPVLLAAIAQQTQRVRLGPAVCVLPFHDPVKVAEEYAVLDVISNWRLEFGVGRGYLEHEYAGHRVDRDDSQARFDEALEVLELAWAGQPFEYTGRFHRYTRITLNTLPLQQPTSPIATAALSPATYARIGARGGRLLSVPYVLEDISVLGDLLKGYTEAATAPQVTEDGPRVSVAFHIHVAPSRAEAESRTRPYICRHCETRALGNSKDFAQLMRQRLIAVGDPNHVSDILRQLGDFGVDRVVSLMNFGGMPFAMVKESTSLLAREVMPRLAS